MCDPVGFRPSFFQKTRHPQSPRAGTRGVSPSPSVTKLTGSASGRSCRYAHMPAPGGGQASPSSEYVKVSVPAQDGQRRTGRSCLTLPPHASQTMRNRGSVATPDGLLRRPLIGWAPRSVAGPIRSVVSWVMVTGPRGLAASPTRMVAWHTSVVVPVVAAASSGGGEGTRPRTGRGAPLPRSGSDGVEGDGVMAHRAEARHSERTTDAA